MGMNCIRIEGEYLSTSPSLESVWKQGGRRPPVRIVERFACQPALLLSTLFYAIVQAARFS